MKKTILLLFSLMFCLLPVNDVVGQRKNRTAPSNVQEKKPYERPRLVVGIVVDQMRYDYLTRYWDKYPAGGFKRLVNDGFNCRNNHFNYMPTYTGPGHASIYTGTPPAVHGIIGNDWYDKASRASVYCVEDESYQSIGTNSDAGQKSPRRMVVSTIADQMRLHSQNRSKTIAIAIKDRGAVLPGGHTANAAYWFHGEDEGKWVSSSYYMDALPAWVNTFNVSDAAEKYKKPWEPLLKDEVYNESGADNTAYESPFEGAAAPVFPHDLPALWEANDGFEILKSTPFGNSLTTDFALAALENEALGKDAFTDFLTISYSSTDYVGHKFGVNSKEVEDTYLRLDRDLARLLNALDASVGAGEYLVFLTADHGAVDVPAYLSDQRIPAGYPDEDALTNELREFLSYAYGTTDIILAEDNMQIFLDHKVIENLGLQVGEVQSRIAREVLRHPYIARVYTGQQMVQNDYFRGLSYLLQNGYHHGRSGDVLILFNPAQIFYSKTGSTHGSPFPYDTHVPLIFYGKGIKKGSTADRTEITDIAPTLAVYLGIAFPNGSTGTPIIKLLD